MRYTECFRKIDIISYSNNLTNSKLSDLKFLQHVEKQLTFLANI